MERIIATSYQSVGDNDDHEHIDEIRDSNNQSSHSAEARPATRRTSDETDSDDEIGALIYQQSRTAKARAAVSEKAKAKRTIPNEESDYASQPKKTPSRRVCSHEGCDKYAQRRGVCIRHGGKPPSRRRCSHEGCTNVAQNGGICVRHGAKRKGCSQEGCMNNAVKGGVCFSHRAKYREYSYKGYTSKSQRGGVNVLGMGRR